MYELSTKQENQHRHPVTTWRRMLVAELKDEQMSCTQAKEMAEDRSCLRDVMTALCSKWSLQE